MEGTDARPVEMNLTRPLLIINPNSGRYSNRRVRHVAAELTRFGLAPQIVEVRTPQETFGFFRDNRILTEHPFIVVAAGDGTINAVLNCIEPYFATLAVLPLGTVNVLAAELGISSVEDGLERIARGDTRQLPVGLLQLADSKYFFLLMAGIGLDGAVARDVRPAEKRFLKQGAFILSSLRNACSWDHTMIEIASGGKSLFCHTVVVSNASHYGGSFVLAPDLNLFSPGFSVTCITSDRRAGYLSIALDLLRKRVGCGRDMIQMTCDNIEIRGNKPIQIDGDFVGYGPAAISAVTDFANIVV